MYTLKSSKQKTTFVLVDLEKLETENNLCASRDIRLVAILKQQLEGLVSCEDVQIVER